MVALSKFFNEYVKFRTCNEIVHPGPCAMNSFHNTYKFFLSNFKYFAPITLLPLLVKIRSCDKKSLRVLRETLKYFVQCVLSGTLIGWSIQALICIFRNYFGEFRYWYFLFVPSSIGAMISLFCSTRLLHIFKVSIIQCTIESFLLKRKNVVTRTMYSSNVLQGWIFMFCSACILHAKQKKLYKGFWFLVPNPCAQNITDSYIEQQETHDKLLKKSSKCTHTQHSCNLYFIQGVCTYLAIGLTLDLLKTLIHKAPSKPNQTLFANLWTKFANINVNSSVFLSSYVGAYRFLHCYLNRKSKLKTEVNHFIASYLAGSSYLLLPRLSLFAYTILICTEAIWKILVASIQTKFEQHPQEAQYQKKVQLWHIFKRLPISNMIYVYCMGYLVHTYVVRSKYTSPLGETIINGVTNNYGRNIKMKLESLEKQMTEQLRNSS